MSMRNSSDSFPEPPELPSFRVEEEAPVPVGERHVDTGLLRHDVALDEDRIDPDAAKVVRRLERSGFQAYLVGGCVRDLLLGGKPKDYDVATSARPEDVRGLFRNCRIIGRRFRLAHVMFGGRSYGRGQGNATGGMNGNVKIVEVATFRKMPHELTALGASASDASGDEDLIIRNDNVFGEAHEDALRRDFTINALFYDLDRRQVLDWCGGMDDIQQRVIRTIGEPSVRFREDPIRILRAIKFASRLDLGLDPTLYEAAVFHREELAKAAKARVFEEILRLLRGGASSRSIYLLWEIGAMAVLLPELSAYLDDDEGTGGGSARIYRRLRAVDKITRARGAIDDIALWTTLLYEPMKELASGGENADEVDAFLEDLIRRLNMPRRVADGVGRITKQLPRLRKGQFGRFMLTELGAAALDVLEVDLLSKGRDAASITHLRRQRAEAIANAPRQRRPSR